MKAITRSDYMANSSELHHKYWMQFITPSTLAFVRDSVGLDRLLRSGDYFFNDIGIKHVRNTWIWDRTPVNIELMRELGEIGQRSLPSPSAHTCVGKAAARVLVQEYRDRNKDK